MSERRPNRDGSDPTDTDAGEQDPESSAAANAPAPTEEQREGGRDEPHTDGLREESD